MNGYLIVETWFADELEAAASGSFASLTLVAGVLIQNPAADAASVKVYLTSAGDLVAKTAAGGGDRLITLSGGNLVAN